MLAKRNISCIYSLVDNACDMDIPDLMKEIELEYKNHDTALRVQVQSSYDNPTSIQKTIGNSQPETTSEIVRKKRSRFFKKQQCKYYIKNL